MLGKQCAFHVRIIKLPSSAHPPGLSPGRPPPGHRDRPTATAPERKAFRSFPGLLKSWKWEQNGLQSHSRENHCHYFIDTRWRIILHILRHRDRNLLESAFFPECPWPAIHAPPGRALRQRTVTAAEYSVRRASVEVRLPALTLVSVLFALINDTTNVLNRKLCSTL